MLPLARHRTQIQILGSTVEDSKGTSNLGSGVLCCMEAKHDQRSGSWTQQTSLDATEELRTG